MPRHNEHLRGRVASVTMRSLVATASVLLAVMLLGPGQALAQTLSLPPGVHIDPGSPASKAYQIPLPSARSEAAGGSGVTPAGSSSNPPLFGVGITPASGSSGASGEHSAGTQGATKSRTTSHAASNASATATRATDPPVLPPAPAVAGGGAAGKVGGSAWLPLVIGGALVLLIGGGGGLALRRRSQRP